MHKMTIALAGTAALLLTGCRPELAKEKFGEEDALWANRLGENYRGYQAPRTYAPALVDKYETMPAASAAKEDAPAVMTPAAVPAAAPDLTVEEIAANPAPEAAKPAEPAVKPADPAAKPAEPAEPAAKPSAGEAVNGEIYVVKSGDTLSGIAKKFYKDARRADLIFQANQKVLKDANQVRPGMKLLIPAM